MMLGILGNKRRVFLTLTTKSHQVLRKLILTLFIEHIDKITVQLLQNFSFIKNSHLRSLAVKVKVQL